MTIQRVREATMVYGPQIRPKPPAITSSRDLAAFLATQIGPSIVERFVAVALDARNRPLCWGVISTGTIKTCPVAVADVLRFVILSGGPSFVIAHNHPSGDPAPSAEDLLLTQTIADFAKMLGLALIDHLIVVQTGDYRSFLDMGLLSR